MRGGEGFTLFEGAADDRLEGRRFHPNRGARDSFALGDRFGADVDHTNTTAIIEMREFAPRLSGIEMLLALHFRSG